MEGRVPVIIQGRTIKRKGRQSSGTNSIFLGLQQAAKQTGIYSLYPSGGRPCLQGGFGPGSEIQGCSPEQSC